MNTRGGRLKRLNGMDAMPMDTAGTIGAPASIADLTYPVRPLKSTMFSTSVGRYAS